ncbi:MAG: hypothetical protein ABMB14_03070 [Myxococcota bacterium]
MSPRASRQRSDRARTGSSRGWIVALAAIAAAGAVSMLPPRSQSGAPNLAAASTPPGPWTEQLPAPAEDLRVPGTVEELEIWLRPGGAAYPQACCAYVWPPESVWSAAPRPLGWIGPHLRELSAPDADPRFVGRVGVWLAEANPWLGVVATDLAIRWWHRDPAQWPVIDELADVTVRRAAGGPAADLAAIAAAQVDVRLAGDLRYTDEFPHQRALLDQIRDADPAVGAVAATLLHAPPQADVDPATLAALRDLVAADPGAYLGAVAFGVQAAYAADRDLDAWVALADRAADCRRWECGHFRAVWRSYRARIAPPGDWRDALLAAVVRCAPEVPPPDPVDRSAFRAGFGVYHLDGWTFWTSPDDEWLFDCAADVDLAPPLGQRVRLRIVVTLD